MHLKTLFSWVIALATVSAVSVVVVAHDAATSNERAALTQLQALDALREARGLVVLTYEFGLYGQPRSVAQWRARYLTLVSILQQAGSHSGEAKLLRLQGELESLPQLFDQLVATHGTDQSEGFRQRQRELLIDTLITDTQTILDAVYDWGLQGNAARTSSESHLARLAAITPFVMLAVLLLLAAVLLTRVIRPIRHLQRTMNQFGSGDLSVRRNSLDPGEVGDLSRAFDGMAAALERTGLELASNELRLRTITDNLPAQIAYIDVDQRYQFANRVLLERLGLDHRGPVVGESLRTVHSGADHARIAPELAAALAGERRSFQVNDTRGGVMSCREYVFIPDRDPLGKVHGCYAMVHDVTETELARQRVEQSLQEKDVMLKEIHHRVKNNMQVISSLLTLQLGQVSSPEVHALLTASQNRIKSMALVHEMLYQNANLAAIEFADYVRNLVRVLESSHTDGSGRVRVALDLQPVSIDIDQAIPAGLVLNELISNAFKHAFPGGAAGCISIQLSPASDGHVRMAVGDDGVGARDGFDLASGPTLGMRLVRILAGQLDAQLEVSLQDGFHVSLVFLPHSPRRPLNPPGTPAVTEATALRPVA